MRIRKKASTRKRAREKAMIAPVLRRRGERERERERESAL